MNSDLLRSMGYEPAEPEDETVIEIVIEAEELPDDTDEDDTPTEPLPG